MTRVDEIMADEQLAGRAKRHHIFAYLAGQPDLGVEIATRTLLATGHRAVAEYLAQYLEVVPGAAEAKTRAAERLRQHDVLVSAAARLVPWLPGELLDGFVADYLAGDPKSPVSSVIATMGIYAPDRLRPFEDRIANERVREGLLSGAPDSTVDELTDAWRAGGDEEILERLALVRTDYALARVRALRDELDPPVWEMLVELAGGLPHREGMVGNRPVYLGFVVEAGKSPHIVGGYAGGEVPICMACSAPSSPLLSLRADALPYGLANDPVFYWYNCTCDEMDSATVRVGPEGLTAYHGPTGPANPKTSVTGGERSLVLEEHPNQRGVSMPGLEGETQHQVGGLPQWRRPDLHPRCPECHNAMPFLAFLDSGRTPFGELDFGGMVYCFWCDDCRVSSTKIQSQWL